jgi:hypothetical protein
MAMSSIFNTFYEIGEVTKIMNEIEEAIEGRPSSDKRKILINTMKACNDMRIKTKTIDMYIYCLAKTYVNISSPLDFLQN